LRRFLVRSTEREVAAMKMAASPTPEFARNPGPAAI